MGKLQESDFNPANHDIFESQAQYNPAVPALSNFQQPFLVGSQGPKGDIGDKGDSTREIFLVAGNGTIPNTPTADSYTNGAFVNLTAGWTTNPCSI